MILILLFTKILFLKILANFRFRYFDFENVKTKDIKFLAYIQIQIKCTE